MCSVVTYLVRQQKVTSVQNVALQSALCPPRLFRTQITHLAVVLGTQRVGVAGNLRRFYRTDFNGSSTVRGYDQALATTAF